jgi:hypothetical protein
MDFAELRPDYCLTIERRGIASAPQTISFVRESGQRRLDEP